MTTPEEKKTGAEPEKPVKRAKPGDTPISRRRIPELTGDVLRGDAPAAEQTIHETTRDYARRGTDPYSVQDEKIDGVVTTAGQNVIDAKKKLNTPGK